MDTSENFLGPPGRPDGAGLHASIASAESHRVTSPRRDERLLIFRPIPTVIFGLVLRMNLRLHPEIVGQERRPGQLIGDHDPRRVRAILHQIRPSSTSQSLHSCDRPIPRTRPWSPPRHRRRLGRRNHDPGTSRTGRLVERDGIVGGVRGHARDVPVHLLDQTDAGRRVIGCRLRDRLGNDYAGAVDTEVQLLPAARAAGPVFYGGPLAFADDRQSCAIDDEMHRALGRNAIECQIEMLTPTRECLGAQLAISVNNCPPPRDPRSRMTSFKRTQRKYVQKAYRVRN